MKDIVNKSFYLTSNFNNIKSGSNWPRNESILACDILSQLSEHKIFLPDLGDIENVDLILKELRKRVKDIPKEYIISKKSFLEATGVSVSHAAREIKKAIRGLSSKIIITPHPLRPMDKNSASITPWFSRIDYDDIKGQIYVKLNEEAIERLIAFVKYSHIRFENIVKLSSQYSILTYLTIKILQEGFKQKHLVLTIEEYKEKLGLQGKYKDNNLFKKKVLDIVEDEIDKYTDIEFQYQLIKEGRSYNKIRFTFDYKPKYLEQKPKKKTNNLTFDNDIDSPFEATLVGWGIRAKKVVEIEESYSLDVIQDAIDLTLEKEKAGEIKTTKAAIFLGILENKQLTSDEIFEREKYQLQQQQEKEYKKQLSAEYDKLYAFVLANEDIIKSALTANTKHLPITDPDADNVFKKLKKIDDDKYRGYTTQVLSFYHFESGTNVPLDLSSLVDWSNQIIIKKYKDDYQIIEAYKQAYEKIKTLEYFSDEQKEQLKKEVQETINLLLGF